MRASSSGVIWPRTGGKEGVVFVASLSLGHVVGWGSDGPVVFMLAEHLGGAGSEPVRSILTPPAQLDIEHSTTLAEDAIRKPDLPNFQQNSR